MFLGNKILVLAPHTDDGEFGCGASIAKFIKEGKDVLYAAFSIAEDSVPDPFPVDILETEVVEATNALGLSHFDLSIHKYPVRQLGRFRQEILEDLVRLNKTVEPDVVFMPSLNDIHQDHRVIAEEGLRAFKKTTVLCYELPWNNLNFTNTCFIRFGEAELDQKVKAMGCYKSQQGKGYASEEFIRALALTRGTQIGVRYAEVFEVLRLVI
jgi:LmbE family N-acetylglucosaminyl deacetylase